MHGGIKPAVSGRSVFSRRSHSEQPNEGRPNTQSSTLYTKTSYDPHTPLGPRVSASPLTNADDALLESLGYKAELKREFSTIQLFGMSFAIMSIAPSISSVLTDQIPAGGVGLTWGWFVPCFFIFSIGISMSEFASAMPTAGGLYWWAYKFAPQKLKSYLSFLCGYADSLGLAAGAGSINYGAAQQVLSCLKLSTSYTNPSNGVVFALYVGICILQCLIGFLPNKVIARLQVFTIFFNIAIIAVICIALPVGMQHKGIPLNSGKFVFGDTTNNTNYPYGMSFLMTWMAAIWSISSQDSCVHMAEEAANAATAVPIGILASVGLCWVFGFLILAILAACMDPSAEGIKKLATASFPMANIMERALNRKWTIGILSTFSVIQFGMGLSALISCSRQFYAFARDDALPLSRIVKKTTKGQLPVPAIIFTVVVELCLGLLLLAGPIAANAIFNLGMASLYLAWCMPIILYAFSAQRLEKPGPFYLGHTFSKINAVVASLFGFLVMFGLCMLPTDVPVTNSSTMNYTCVVCGAVWIGASLYWLIDARKWYNGPKQTLEDDPELKGIIETLEKEQDREARLEQERAQFKSESQVQVHLA